MKAWLSKITSAAHPLRLSALVALLLSLALPLMHGGCRNKGLPVYDEAPAFQLTQQDGTTFDSSQLRGHVWIVNFIFTRCTSFCPKMTADMVSLQRNLSGIHPRVKFVSISVDPEYDTPETLLKYATFHRADLKNGTFLTGKLDVVKNVVIKGFKQSMEPILKDSTYDIAHSGRFVLIDKKMRIRGFYEAGTFSQQRKIVKDASFLTQKR